MYFVLSSPAKPLRLFYGEGVDRSAFSIKGKCHGAPTVWLGTKVTYPICPMLHRRPPIGLSLSKIRQAVTSICETEKGESISQRVLFNQP